MPCFAMLSSCSMLFSCSEHYYLMPKSWCPNLCCKSAICCYLLVLSRTWRFVFFVSFNLCILWAWSLHVFCCMPCHLSKGVCHVFWWSLWWLEQACKLGSVMFLISGTVISPSLCLLWFCCHVNSMLQRDPCIFWRCSVRMFCSYYCNWSVPTLFLQLWSTIAWLNLALLLL